MKPLIRPGSRPPRQILASLAASFVGRFARPIWTTSVVLTVVSLLLLTRYSSGILETDLSQLRNRRSLESGSSYHSRFLDEIFQRYLSPLAILPHSRENAIKIAARLKEVKAHEGKDSLIASVQTLDDFIPKQQEEKIRILQEIRKELSPRIFYRMPEADQKIAQGFLTDAVTSPIGLKDLPPLLLEKFTEKDGSVGKLVLVEPPLGGATDQGDRLVAFINDLRNTADQIEPHAAVAGSLTITADMIQAISRDGPKATLFALFAVTLLVIVVFRNFTISALTLLSLYMGVTWLVGLILAFWIKINFLNFIALPITFGIGVDYGVNMFHRYREEGGANILGVIRHTGGAVALCSFTTITGYFSLLIASNKAFVSFGLLAVLGELTCVIAAVISLPAYLLLRHRRAAKLKS